MIQVDNLSLRAGNFRLSNVSMSVQESEYAVLMGRTGSGKTTLIESLCGLQPIESGRIVLGGVDVTFLPPAQRNIGYVPQDGALFPAMTVRRHLAFPLEVRRWPQERISRRTDELARLLSIEPILDRRPAGLSGGEAQRVALGRALSFRPTTLLLDEPLSSLDEQTRQEMIGLLRDVCRSGDVATLHVTHSREEAAALADRFFVLVDGKLQLEDRTGGTPLTPRATLPGGELTL
ncbi:MAG: ATP-binding cassette domain-containing protein [Bythopirellula sp.]